jgi:hypothetical protein
MSERTFHNVLAAPVWLFVLAWWSVAEAAQPSDAGRQFFYDSVLPKLVQNGCPSCHAVGYMHPSVTDYDELLRRLAIGDSATNNVIIYTIANVRSIAPDLPTHPGGQRCQTVNSEPCASIQRWWKIEFGNSHDHR